MFNGGFKTGLSVCVGHMILDYCVIVTDNIVYVVSFPCSTVSFNYYRSSLKSVFEDPKYLKES